MSKYWVKVTEHLKRTFEYEVSAKDENDVLYQVLQGEGKQFLPTVVESKEKADIEFGIIPEKK